MALLASQGTRVRQLTAFACGALALIAAFMLPHRFGSQQIALIAATSWPSLALLSAAGAALGAGGALWNAAYGQAERELYMFGVPLGAALLGGFFGKHGAAQMIGGVLFGAALFAAASWLLLRRNRLTVFVLAAAVPGSVYGVLWAAGYGKARLVAGRAFLLWLLGDASDASGLAALLVILATLLLLVVSARRGNAVSTLSIVRRDTGLSSAERANLGMLGFALCGLAFGAVGPVAFVGSAAPWFALRFAGPQRPGTSLVLSALAGAATLTLLDAVPRALVGAFTYPLAMQTVLVFGVPCAVLWSRQLARSGAPPQSTAIDWLLRAWLFVIGFFAFLLVAFAAYLGALFK